MATTGPDRVAPADLSVARAESDSESASIVIATMMRKRGHTGVQTHVAEVDNYLRTAGRSVVVVTPFSRGRPLSLPMYAPRYLFAALNGSASVAWYRYWHFLFLRHALGRELARVDDAVVYAQCPLAALAALESRRDPRQRVVMAVHFDISQADEWVYKRVIPDGGLVYRQIRKLEHRTIPMLDGIVYVSNSARAGVRSHVHGVEAIASATIANFTRDVGAAVSAPVSADLITIGGLEPHKNQAFLLDVLAAANRLGRRYTLDVVGDGRSRQSLVRHARALNVDGQVAFLGARRNARALLPGHRAYVHAATHEVLPLAVVEAMGAGLPILVGPIGGLPEMFDDGAQGLLWPLDDADAAARMLVDLLDDEPRRARMGAASRARFSTDFDAAVVGPRLERFLEPCARAPAHVNGDAPARENFQQLAFGEDHDYARGSPHLKHPQLRELVGASVRASVATVRPGRSRLEALEVGAGHGPFTEVLRSAGAHVTITEMSKPSADFLVRHFRDDRGVEVIYDEDGTWVFDTDREFDVVVCVSVLHHIPDYLGAIRRYAEITRPGGTFTSWQDPLWYDRLEPGQRRAAMASYYAWRTTQGLWGRGAKTMYRRIRGVLDESNPADMVEYHVVRQGVDERAVERLLRTLYESVVVEAYWSTQSAVLQSWGERRNLVSTFGVTATRRTRRGAYLERAHAL